ncbi:unnamed protein product [Calypogeia fissa]
MRAVDLGNVVVGWQDEFQQAQDTVTKLDLDGLLVIDGDDSNTTACLLAEFAAAYRPVRADLVCGAVLNNWRTSESTWSFLRTQSVMYLW